MSSSLAESLKNAAFAFRGYNVTNLGRTPELLKHPAYGAIVEQHLRVASAICSESIGQRVDLVKRVKSRTETSLEDYAEAISLIIAVEQAHIRLLNEFFGLVYESARYAFGFSLGEISALVSGQVYSLEAALKVPLAMAADCVELAKDVSLGVLISRDESISTHDVNKLFLEINAADDGVIGMSTYLSPNSILVLGTGTSLERFRQRIKTCLPKKHHLRQNENRWPPLHTSIVWNKNIPNRSACMLRTLPGGLTAPTLPILSLVTGDMAYTDINSREIINQWIDHPQRLWDVVSETLTQGVGTIIHVGPAPNIIPATFERLSTNVESLTKGSRRMRALSAVVRRPWLQSLLPKRTALLRATMIEHVMLEDWLLEQTVP